MLHKEKKHHLWLFLNVFFFVSSTWGIECGYYCCNLNILLTFLSHPYTLILAALLFHSPFPIIFSSLVSSHFPPVSIAY